MAVNHFRVSFIINGALAAVNQQGTLTSVTRALESAWTAINSRRLRGDCGEDLAAAEHYLFCRYLIARYSTLYIPILQGMSDLYDMSKLFGIQYREGTCPQAPPSLADRAWRMRGMDDGSDDFLGLTRVGMLGAPSNPWSSSGSVHLPNLSGNAG